MPQQLLPLIPTGATQISDIVSVYRNAEADILPDRENKQLIIRVHNSSRAAADKYLAQLFEHLNQAQIDYPGTDLRLVYQLGGISDG